MAHVEKIKQAVSAPAIASIASALFLLATGWLNLERLQVALWGLAALLSLAAFVWLFRRIDFSSTRFVNATPEQLAWIRIVVCLTALILTVIEDLPAISSLPTSLMGDQRFFSLVNALPGYVTLLSNRHALAALQWSTAVLIFLALCGFKTRLTLFLGGIGYFSVQAILRQYTYYFHTGLVPLYLLLLLSWTPCGSVWSLDRKLNPQKAKPNPNVVGLAIYACFAVLALIYLFCGLSKLRESGVDWFRADNIQNKFVHDAMNPIFLDYKWKATIWLVQHHAPGFVYTMIGGIGTAIELGYVGVLVSRTAQKIMPIAAFGLHLGILLLQHILFLDMLILQFIFLNPDWIRNFAGRTYPRMTGANVPRSPTNSSVPSLPSPVALVSVSMVLVGLILVWVARIEYYPLSKWELYSGTTQKKQVTYCKMVASLEDGRVIPVPNRDYSPAVMPNSSSMLTRAFARHGRNERFDEFLASYVKQRHRDLRFGSPISSIEVQAWRWNYAANPNDPHLGWQIGSYPYDAIGKN